MNERQQEYIPALSFRFLTPFFDFIQKYIMRDMRYKSLLIEQANIQPGHKVLDLGCGTGTLAIMEKESQQKADVTGLDADPEMLEIAIEKSASHNIDVKFDVGFTDKLPYPDASFDRVMSSIMIHHLKTPEKEAARARSVPGVEAERRVAYHRFRQAGHMVWEVTWSVFAWVRGSE